MPEYKCEHCNDTGVCPTKPGIRTRWACQDCDAGRCKTCGGSGKTSRPLRQGEPNPLLADVDYDQITVYESCPDCSCRQNADDSDHSGDATDMMPPCDKCDGSGMVNTRYADGTPSREIADFPDCTDHIGDHNKMVQASKNPEKIDTSDQCVDATDMIPPNDHGVRVEGDLLRLDGVGCQLVSMSHAEFLATAIRRAIAAARTQALDEAIDQVLHGGGMNLSRIAGRIENLKDQTNGAT